jgi:arylsulfatase A-like enzyme
MRFKSLAVGISVVAAFASAAARAGPAAEPAARRPNLVILLADQLRYQSLGYAGDRRAITPRLDRLAAQGVSFRNYVVSTPVCAACRATLLTGKYASTTGMVINELRLNPNQDCLGHVLTAAGYETSYLGKWHLWANELGGHGKIGNAFTPPGPYRLGFDGFWAAYNFNHQNYSERYFRDTPEPHRIDGYGPDQFTDLAIARLGAHARSGKPFALVLSYSPPHDPWDAGNVPKAWYDKFRGVDFPLPETWQDRPDPRMDRNAEPQRWLSFWKPRLPEFMRVYYAMTANLDWNVGRILDSLRELGIDDNTIVVFTSDHGEQFGAHGRVFKMTFYDESARVPLLVRWPAKIPAGRVSEACMASADLMPTLLGLAGLRIPSQVEGMDLAAEALGKPGPLPEFAFLQGMGHTCSWSDGFEWRALRDKQFTYAVYRSDGKEILIDNVADPRQAKDLSADSDQQAKLVALRGKLKRKMAGLGDTFEACSWYRDHWTQNRIILRGAKGEFRRETGPNVPVDVNLKVEAGREPAAPKR